MASTAQEASRKSQYSRRRYEETSEIGPPPITDEQRLIGEKLRIECQHDLEAFNVKVFPRSSGLKPLGSVQKTSIAHDQTIIVDGGRGTKAEPRGYGKTTRTCNAGMWGVLYNYRKMVPVFSANMEKSKNQIMARWKAEFSANELLFWMFPELIWPFRALENKSQRCKSQTFNGQLTHLQWNADRIVFPHLPDNPASGSLLVALPLASCRGATHTMPDGTILRPDLVIFDDVQKDEDAANPNTVRKTEELIEHSAMMLGSHAKRMSAIMNCTVREADDLSEVYLKKTGWRRVRYKMLAERADKEKELWLGAYADIRRSYDPENPDDQKRAHKEALQFYLDHIDAMEAGAKATWEWAYNWDEDDPTELSAIQHAYNILIDSGETVFAAECQNEPLRDTGGLAMLTPVQMCGKQSGYGQNVVPAECSTLTAFVDVHPEILYWEVWAWEPNFTGYLIDYGQFPEQAKRNFGHKSLSKKLSDLFPGYDASATITAALAALLHGDQGIVGLMQREWTRTDGVPLKIGRCGIDANGEASDDIKKFIRQSPYMPLLVPTYGRGVKASQMPISLWQQSKGKNVGPEWTLTKGKAGDPVGCTFDTNWWKTHFHRAMALPPGSQGGSYVFKVSNPEYHRRLGEHWCSERPKEIAYGHRKVYEFSLKPGCDNHDLDCAIGNRIMASMAGITSVKSGPAKKKLSLAALQQQKRSGRAA